MKNSFFINKRAISWLMILTIIFLGYFGLKEIPLELQPEITIPIASVTTFLPGANPEDIETLITKPLEKEVANISDIKELSSISGLGLSLLIVEFEAESDLDEAVSELKDKIDIAKTDLPEDATEPLVTKVQSNALPIISFSITGDFVLKDLTKIAEDMEEELKKIPEISNITIIGNLKKEILIAVDREKAANYGLSLSQIAQIIKASYLNFPIGIITTDRINYSITFDNRFKELKEIENLPLFTANDTQNTLILLKDFATVKENLRDTGKISKLSIKGETSKETVTLKIFKKDNANIIDLVEKSKAKIEELKGTKIPSNVEIAITNDNAQFIRDDLGLLTSSGIQTTILITIALFLALGLTEGILAGLSIPLTLLSTIAILQAFGMTINGLTLFAMVIAVGIMVDTAIVVMEGIHENIKKGLSAKEAAIASIATYKWPLIAGTVTTVFAFLPMLLVSGIVGQFLKALPITISAALLSSLFISLTIIPAITVKFLENKNSGNKKSLLAGVFNFLGVFFEKIIGKIIHYRPGRVFVVSVTLIFFALSMLLPITGILKAELFPKTNMQFFIINIETLNGLNLEETEKIVEQVENELYQIKEIDNFLTIIGDQQSLAATDIVQFTSAGNSNQANITVNLVPKEDRTKTSYEISSELREKLKPISNAKIFVREISEGPPSESPVTVRITGEDLKILEKIADDIVSVTEKIPKTENVRSSLKPGLNQFKFTLDREKLAFHGLSPVNVAVEIRNLIQGTKSTEIFLRSEDLEINVKFTETAAKNPPEFNIDDLQNTGIFSPKGYKIALKDIGSYSFEEAVSEIEREDQKRIIKVQSDITKNANAVEITAAIEKKLKDHDLPEGYEISYGGDLEEINKSFQELFRSMGLAIVLIGFCLVLMFNSLKQPFIILLTLPMALIGVLPGLFLVNLQLSFPAFLGIVALAGIVVNDAIVLIDSINENIKNGIEFNKAICESASSRLQPIIMTSITTILGILPLVFTNEFWAGLGYALIFGLMASTFLTLLVVPVLYYMFEKKKATS
ncbi:efflux RND transporter permease subunit [Candidatus Peregrinibacteria bacterium]|nr:efflux RND transporter permease subunit [Candidatus Peregrinibacteria bacterium]